jgi:hypothetical protein
MINHARALLVNQTAAARPPLGAYGEEYTPAEYIPFEPVREQRAVRRLLFGAAPDALFLNSRLRLLLAAAHQTPTVDGYLRSLDSRVTYDGRVEPIITDTLMEATPVGSPAMSLHLFGPVAADEVEGVSVFGYQVIAGIGDLTVVDHAFGSTRRQAHDAEPPILSCGARLRFAGDWSPGIWNALVAVPSARGLPDLYADLSGVGATVTAAIAGAASRWRELWHHGIGITARLAGLTAALVEVSEAARHG